jgi:hypothetical protein
MNPTKIGIIAIVLCFLLPIKGHPEISKPVVTGADDIKPEYNIVIWNLTDGPIKNIVVVYGDETFKISRMGSFTFKMRTFVDYDVPATVIFQWEDIQGNKYKKKATMPPYKLDVDSLSSLFLRINAGNTFSIAWQGYGTDEYFSAYSKIEDAVRTAASEMEVLMDVNLVGKSPFLTVDENGNDLCYEFVNAPPEKTCQAAGATNKNIRYFKTLEDIVDIVIFLHNQCDGDVSPYNGKPLFTKMADAPGQVAILIVGELEAKIIGYDNERNIVTSVNVMKNK